MFKNLCAVLIAFGLSQSALASGTKTYVGIGVTIHQDQDAFQVIDVNTNGPALHAGVQLNDWITAVDSKPTKGLKLDEVVGLIQGVAGTPVTLTLEDDKSRTPHEVTITRSLVTLQCTIEGSYSMNLFGSDTSGTISGYMGFDRVYLDVFGGFVTGSIGREYVRLRLESYGFDWMISGFLRSTYVTWRSSGNMFFGYQECIQ